ncbi:MAG TPA: trypsin-like serine protease, partial [Aquificaceae bacterium]|nr:trypsin-like serine protease [Aquificaceae bacterium]
MGLFSFLLVLFLLAGGCKAQSQGSVLEAFEAELTGIIDEVSPSVVTIFAVQEVEFNPFEGFDLPFRFPIEPFKRERRSLGSGVIVKHERGKLYILTNNHVVEDAKLITVRLDKHTEKRARVVGKDPKTDIAVLEISAEGIEGIPDRIARLGDSDKVRVGQIVIAIGNPYGLERTVTVGVVSALSRSIGITQYENYIQTDAAINPGNSGGPLINIKGEVIGINTAIVASGQGLGFAIPINLARWVMEQILEHGRVVR